MTAPGPSGLRAEHLLLAFRPGSAATLVSLVSRVADGDGPDCLRHSRLLAIDKSGGGVRPIAIGDIIRRVAATVLLRASEASLPPRRRQFGHRPDGCLAVASCVREAVARGMHVAQIDVRNAFNTLDRSALLAATCGTLLHRYAAWAYASPTRLICDDGTELQSLAGVQQGDGLAPTLFALTLAAAIDAWQTSLPNGTTDMWFADDATLVSASADELHDAVDAIEAPLLAVGLSLAREKSVWWSDSTPPSGFPSSPGPTLVSLGFPVAGDIGAYVDEKVRKAVHKLEPLHRLRHAQGETAILRACGPWSRLSHLLRWLPLASLQRSLSTADACTQLHLSRILVRDLAARDWAQATLPISLGGFGLGALTSHAHADPLLSNANASAIAALAGCDDPFISSVVDTLGSASPVQVALHVLPGSDDVPDADRLSAQGAPQAGAWVLGPVRGPTLFSDPQWRIAVAVWLGMDAPFGHTSCSQHSTHRQGLSRLGCKNAGNPRNQRHEALAVQLIQCAGSAGIKTKREMRFDHSCKERPGDIVFTLPDGDHFADVTVTSPANFPRPSPASCPTIPAAAAYDRKITKYNDQRAAAGLDPAKFVPLAVTAYGAWDGRSAKFLERLAFCFAGRTGSCPIKLLNDMYCRLSAALWKGNAAMMLWDNPRLRWDSSG